MIWDCSRGTTISFIQHMYDEDRVKKRGAMSQYRAQFGILYNRENGRLMDSNDRKEVLKVCCFLFIATSKIANISSS